MGLQPSNQLDPYSQRSPITGQGAPVSGGDVGHGTREASGSGANGPLSTSKSTASGAASGPVTVTHSVEASRLEEPPSRWSPHEATAATQAADGRERIHAAATDEARMLLNHDPTRRGCPPP